MLLADEKDRNRALDGDLVAVEIKGKETARIVAVVERRHRTRVAGLLKVEESTTLCRVVRIVRKALKPTTH